MTDVEMILEMAEMQKKLDEALLEKGRQLGKIQSYNEERTIFALIDEIGELVHELKGEWCWWKATQKPVERVKVLEELVDAWHFGLSLDNHNERDLKLFDEWIQLPLCDRHVLKKIHSSIYFALRDELVTPELYKLTYALGFTMEEVYNGYIAKNKENYARIERGY